MRAIVRDTYGSPDVLELPHQALGFRVQAPHSMFTFAPGLPTL